MYAGTYKHRQHSRTLISLHSEIICGNVRFNAAVDHEAGLQYQSSALAGEKPEIHEMLQTDPIDTPHLFYLFLHLFNCERSRLLC